MRGGKAAAALAVWPENDSETSLGGGTERAVKQEGGRGAAVEQGDGGAGWRLGAGAAGPAITSEDLTQELTGSEIISCEIEPVLFTHLLTTDNISAQLYSTGNWEVVTYLTQLMTTWSN